MATYPESQMRRRDTLDKNRFGGYDCGSCTSRSGGMADASDSKSDGRKGRVGSSPTFGIDKT